MTSGSTIMNIVKSTFERKEEITILKLFEQYNTIYGVYIHCIERQLSFISIPDVSYDTTLEGYRICLFELGTLLHNIYHNPVSSLFFVDILLDYSNDLAEKNEEFDNLVAFVKDNIPFFSVKVWIKNTVDKLWHSESSSVANDQDLQNCMSIVGFFIKYSDIDFDFDPQDFAGQNDDSALRTEILVKLQEFTQILDEHHYDKISEGDMHILDKLYFELQIMNIDV